MWQSCRIALDLIQLEQETRQDNVNKKQTKINKYTELGLGIGRETRDLGPIWHTNLKRFIIYVQMEIRPKNGP